MRALPPALLALAAWACGPAPAQVAGRYTGQHSLTISAGGSELGPLVVEVSQSGGDISFPLVGCSVQAYADTPSSFRVRGFSCTRYVGTTQWRLIDDSTGTVSAGTGSLTLSLDGPCHAGSADSTFRWTFQGAR